MKLDENYRIETDTNNFTLLYESKTFDDVKKKEVISKSEWYYPELKYALIKYMNESLKSCTSIQEVLFKINELEQQFFIQQL